MKSFGTREFLSRKALQKRSKTTKCQKVPLLAPKNNILLKSRHLLKNSCKQLQPKQIVTWTRLNLFQVYLKIKWSIQYKTFSFWFLITTHGKKLPLSGILSSNSKFLTNFLIQLSRLLSIRNAGYFISQITAFYGLQINVKTFKIYKTIF